MTPLAGVRTEEPAHKAWHRPHLLSQTGKPCWAEAADHAPESLSAPLSLAPCLHSSAGSTGAGAICSQRRPAMQWVRGPQQSPGSLMQDVGLLGQFCRCPWRPRHRSGSRWVDQAQEGARLSLSSTLSDSRICGLTLNCPDVPAQEVMPWQGPMLQQTQMPRQVQAVPCACSPKEAFLRFSVWFACAHMLLGSALKQSCDACVHPTNACSLELL